MAHLDNQPRLPQDLSKFIKEGTITQNILKNPSTLLEDINNQLNITKTNTFKLNTQSDNPFPGGGVANIAFLVGGGSVPNANAVQMASTFWVETIESEITVPSFEKGADPLRLKPKYNAPKDSGAAPPPLPTFKVAPTKTITSPAKILVTYKQIQYA
ncbi:heme-binding protein [Microdochium nivale]|nr:heme-binding protein [Microdochium nivale]